MPGDSHRCQKYLQLPSLEGDSAGTGPLALLQLPERADIIGFANDVLLVVRWEIADVKKVVQMATEWMAFVGREVAAQKTRAAWLGRRRARRQRDEKIRLLRHEAPKYLEVIIEANPLYCTQVAEATKGTARVARAIVRLMANTEEPPQERVVLSEPLDTCREDVVGEDTWKAVAKYAEWVREKKRQRRGGQTGS